MSMEDIVSLCKRRGFIYQGSEVYGGLAGTWDYGPLGVTLKRKVMDLWWKTFVDERDDMYGVDAAILMNQKVWQASGHVDTFTDPLVVCRRCHQRNRADHVEEARQRVGGTTDDWMNASSEDKNLLLCPSKEPHDYTEEREFNMMFETVAGPAGFDDFNEITLADGVSYTKPALGENNLSARIYDKRDQVFLRPETAQGIFTNYKNIVDSFYPDLPFGIAQTGKAFRNEISPRDFVFRSREFEQMEIEYFVDPASWQEHFDKWVADIHSFLNSVGVKTSKDNELDVPPEDRAHYSKKTIDFEFDYPIGRKELLGLAYRTDFDLKNIQEHSGKNMEYRTKDGSKVFIPHVIEPSFGVERLLMAILVSAYTEDEVEGEKRVYLKLPHHIAPVRFAVSPLLKNKPELVEKAREVYKQLKEKHGNVMWDDNGNIGKRYRRQDEIGTPECIVIDFQTLEDDTVTVRDRDTTNQKRIKITEL